MEATRGKPAGKRKGVDLWGRVINSETSWKEDK